MMTTVETAPAPAKKLSKMERLQAELVAARERLTKAETDPRLKDARERLVVLRDKADVARVAWERAYDSAKATRFSVMGDLGLGDSAKVTESLSKWCTERGLPEADAAYLARKYINSRVAADQRVVDAAAWVENLSRRSTSADRARNVADNEVFKMERQIISLRKTVEDLVSEIEALPGRNKAQNKRRASERAEQISAEQTEKALEMLSDFSF